MLKEDVRCFAEKILRWYKFNVFTWNNNWICWHLIRLVFWNTKHLACPTCSNIPVQMQHAEDFCKFFMCLRHHAQPNGITLQRRAMSVCSRPPRTSYLQIVWHHSGIHECAFRGGTIEFGLQENKSLPHRCYLSIWQEFRAFKCSVLAMCAHWGLKCRVLKYGQR